MLAQVLKAPNDTNGNPRRLTMLYLDDGRVWGVRDHGYEGDQIPAHAHILPTVNIAANEYRCILTRYSGLIR